MTLGPGEPEAGPWRVATLGDLARLVRGDVDAQSGRPRIVAVDGRSAGGKSTLANRLCEALPRTAMVHTDDIAWGHSFFGWTDVMTDGVLSPLRAGAAVVFRPPGWDAAGREGRLELPGGLDLVLVEGVGAGRRELTSWLDAVIWVQSDFDEAERRGIARDVASGVNGDRVQTTAFWHRWMDAEVPFLQEDRPWTRAVAIVAGTPMEPLRADEVMLAPALATAQ